MPSPLLSPLDLVKLPSLMALTSGRPEIRIALVDGPVATRHPDLANENIRQVSERAPACCEVPNSGACRHGTFIAGILIAKRSGKAPAICPKCTLLVRPIFSEKNQSDEHMPKARPEDLANAIRECVDAGSRIINLSVALGQSSSQGERQLQDALDHAVRHGVVVVAASGNEGAIGSSVITRHAATIPVVAYDSHARPINNSNFSASIGRRGLGAAGDGVTSLGSDGEPLTLGGTSAAAAFVSGTAALLWSAFPKAAPATIRTAITHAAGPRRPTVVPPLLDAWKAYQLLKSA